MSMGVIGGSDGPTAIFLSSSVNKTAIIWTAVAIVVILIGFLFRRGKNKD